MLGVREMLSACKSMSFLYHERAPFTNQHPPWLGTVQTLPKKMTTYPKKLTCLLSGSQQVKLIDYIHRQRQCKLSVPLNDRTAELNSYPRFNDWLDIVNVRKEVVQVRGRQPSAQNLPVLSRRSQLPAGFK